MKKGDNSKKSKDNSVDVIARHLVGMEGRINKRFDKVENDISGLKLEVTDVKYHVGKLETKINNLDDRVGDLEKSVDTMDRRLSDVENKLDEVVEDHEERLKTLEA